MMDTEWARSSMKKTNSETESECQLLTTSTLITKTTKRCKKLFKLNKINHCNTSSISTNHTKLLHTVLIYPAKLLIPELPMPLSSTPPHQERTRSKLDLRISMILLLIPKHRLSTLIKLLPLSGMMLTSPTLLRLTTPTLSLRRP